MSCMKWMSQLIHLPNWFLSLNKIRAIFMEMVLKIFHEFNEFWPQDKRPRRGKALAVLRTLKTPFFRSCSPCSCICTQNLQGYLACQNGPSTSSKQAVQKVFGVQMRYNFHFLGSNQNPGFSLIKEIIYRNKHPYTARNLSLRRGICDVQVEDIMLQSKTMSNDFSFSCHNF